LTKDAFDWGRMIKDLAQHLLAAVSQEQVGYIIADTERDVGRLGGPADFWSRLMVEYEFLLTSHHWPPSTKLLATKLAPVVRTLIRLKAASVRPPEA
jgi:hypothetical protein